MTPKTTEATPKVTPKRSPSQQPAPRGRTTGTAQHNGGANSAASRTNGFAPPAVPLTPHALANGAFWASLAVLPLGTAGLVRLLAGKSSGARPFAAGAGVVLGLGMVRWQLARWFTEEPTYDLAEMTHGLEIRDYAPMVVAEATIPEADWDRALAEGFRILAEYIFGKNSSRERVAMTAPVQAADRGATNERLPMTAPVAAAAREEGSHTVTFVMPEGRALRSLPLPLDDRIRLRQVSSRQVAVLRFSGSYRGETVRAKMGELEAKVKSAGLRMRGVPSFAGYDAPTTLPFLRRNEVWVEVSES